MIWFFLAAAGFCLYTYVAFPLLLHWRARGTTASVVHDSAASAYRPSVSIVMAAHNEAHRLPAKIASIGALDYPAGQLQVVIVSDGSTDGSDGLLVEVAERLPGFVTHHEPVQSGKASALNTGVSLADGQVLVFMDVRQAIAAEAIHKLVRHLADVRVGAVSGALVLRDDHAMEAASVGLYWRYERWIRNNESRLFSTTGATGALYAIRREDFTPHAADVLLDDFDTPVRLLLQGRRTVFEPAALVFDRAESDSAREFRRKVRTLAGNFQSFRRMPALFDPRRNPVWWQFLSHKVFRLLLPYALVIAFLSAAFGDGLFLDTMLAAQIAFYGLGLAALSGLTGPRNRPANVIKVFLQLNAAAVIGAWHHLCGTAGTTWRRS